MSQTQKTKILDKVLYSESYKQGSYQTLSGPLERTRSQPERTPAGQRWNNLIIIQNNNRNGLKCSDRGGNKRETWQKVSHEKHKTRRQGTKNISDKSQGAWDQKYQVREVQRTGTRSQRTENCSKTNLVKTFNRILIKLCLQKHWKKYWKIRLYPFEKYTHN